MSKDRWWGNKELKSKQKELDGLLMRIKTHAGNPLMREQKQEIENLEGRLEFRLNDLVLKSKIEELDIKIGVFKEVIEIAERFLK